VTVAAAVPSGASVYSTTGGDSYATSSWTPAGATRTYIAFCQACGALSAGRDGTVTGNGLTWTRIGTREMWDSIASPSRQCEMFRARGIASTGVTTYDTGAGTDWGGGIVVVLECDGVDGATNQGVVQHVITPNNASASPHVLTLGAFASAANATLACFMEDINTIDTVEGGGAWASLSSGSFNTPNSSSLTEFRADADTSPSANATNVNWCGMAVELAELVVAAPGPTHERRAFIDAFDPRGWN